MRTLPAVREGLRRSGRTSQEFAIYPQVIVATGRSEAALDAARDGVRALLAFYGATPAYRAVLETHGWGEVQTALHARSRAGAYGQTPALITDEMLHTLAVVGTPEQCAAQIRARFDDHADRVCAYFPGYPVTDEDIADLAAALHAGPAA